MKILYIVQHFSTPLGSAGIRPYCCALGLAAAGHNVTIVCGSYAGGVTGLSSGFSCGTREGEIEKGIHVCEFDLRYSNRDSFWNRVATFFAYAIKATKVALVRDYDVIVCSSTPLTVVIPGIFARMFRRKRFVLEIRDLWPELPKAMGIIKNPILLMALSVLEAVGYITAHRLIGLAPGIVEGIASRGISRDRIRFIPNGCDLSLFGRPGKPWRPVGVNSDDFMVVYAGTHGFANGLDAVLDAARILLSRNRADIKFVFVGDGICKSRLQRRQVEEDLATVIFLDSVEKAVLAELLASADLGLQVLSNVPAFYQGTSPNKFFDYLSASVPVLCNYPGWIAELIREYECGTVVPAGDSIKFADALEELSSCSVKLEIMSSKGVQLARDRFDRSALTEDWVRWVTN